MTFSVAKSYLAVLAGIAFADGLIADPRERVGDRITDGGFDSEQNRSITWEEIDGRRLQSVPGGSHWGGGLWIGARSLAATSSWSIRRTTSWWRHAGSTTTPRPHSSAW